MAAYLVVVHLLLQAQQRPETAFADALDGILTGEVRKYARDHSALIDWATADGDVASFIAAVSRADDDIPDESVLPVWPGRTLP